MKVHCPSCGAEVPARDLNLQTLLARCQSCNNVFSFADAARAETERAGGRVPGDVAAREAPRPPRMIVEEGLNTWTAHWRWFSPGVLGLLFFCVMWDGFLVFWYSIAIAHHGPLIMFLFPLLHVSVGVSLTYFVVASLLNHTRFEVSRDGLIVRSGPVPWCGNRDLPAPAMKQFFTQENSSRNGSSYALFTTLDDGRTLRLAGGFRDRYEAEYLQRQLEKRFNVKPSV